MKKLLLALPLAVLSFSCFASAEDVNFADNRPGACRPADDLFQSCNVRGGGGHDMRRSCDRRGDQVSRRTSGAYTCDVVMRRGNQAECELQRVPNRRGACEGRRASTDWRACNSVGYCTWDRGRH